MAEDIKGQWQTDENGHVIMQEVVECHSINKATLYNRAMNYFTCNYSDISSAILERDQVNGIIIGKGVFKKVYHYNSVLKNISVDTQYILKVEARDGRAKITLTLTEYDESVRGSEPPYVHYLYPVSKKSPFNTASYQADIYKQAFNISHLRTVETIASVEKALMEEGTQKNKDNW